MEQTKKNWKERTQLLLGEDKVNLFNKKHILIVGLGGVGGFAAEMLCRAGIGRMTIVDADIVQPSNINRQIAALHSTIGKQKAEVLAARLKDINPDIDLEVLPIFLKDDNMAPILDKYPYDYVIDAIDTLSPKVYLIALTQQKGLPLISSMGAGAKSDPNCIEIKDLSKSQNCTLARVVRKRLRKMNINGGFPVVFSKELPDKEAVVEIEGETCKKSTAGTISYMPAMFGCHLAAYVLKQLLKKD